MTTTRQDVHSPSHVVMEDYTFVGSYDAHPTAYMVFTYGPNGEKHVEDAPGAERARQMRAMISSSTESRDDGRCDHCGASIRYRAVMRHTPTGQAIQVGETCLDNRFGRATEEFRAMKKAAELDRAAHRIRKAVEAWVAENPDMAWMASETATAEKAGSSWFVVDIARKFRAYGEVTERQVAAVRAAVVREAEFQARKRARDAERAAADAARPTAPVPTGRVTVSGEVFKVKYPEEYDQFPTTKMLVQDDRGFRVWGTVPSAISAVKRGDRVSFSAEVEASKDDPQFGFYRRPTKAVVMVEGSGK